MKLVLKGWKAFEKAIEPKFFGPIMEKHVRIATKQNGIYVRNRIRTNIRSGIDPRNADLTRYIKGGDRPIVGTKGTDLFNSISSSLLAWHSIEVGVFRSNELSNIAQIVHEGISIPVSPRMRQMFWLLWLTEKGKFDPGNLYGRAKELWDEAGLSTGAAPKKGKTKKSGSEKKTSLKKKGKSGTGSGGRKQDPPKPVTTFKPIGLSTTAIVIPARPFIRVVITDAAVMRWIRANWTKALQNAMDEQVRKGKGI